MWNSMLACKKKVIFSSFAGNIYEIQNNFELKGSFRNNCAFHIPEGGVYRLSVVDYNLSNKGKEYYSGLKENFSACFGGHLGGNCFLWPVDYINEFKEKDGIGSIGLLFYQKQFEHLSAASEFLNNNNVVKLFLPLFRSIEKLHECGFSLNGISPEQLFFSEKDNQIKIQALHNCFYCNAETGLNQISDMLSEGSKFLYQEKGFSLPLGSMWRNVRLDTYALCNDIYSLATVLFLILMGRHPMHGRLCDDQEDEEGRKIIYNQTPCFIFDKNDKRNSIGEFEREKKTIERWNQLSSGLKELFCELYDFSESSDEAAILQTSYMRMQDVSVVLPMVKGRNDSSEEIRCFCLGEWINELKNLELDNMYWNSAK